MICKNCLKEFKTQAGYDRHLLSKSCLTLRDRLEWTDLEVQMFRVYSELVSEPKMSTFRNRPTVYFWTHKFVRYCQRHKMNNRLMCMYAVFCQHKKDNTNLTLWRGVKRSTLLSFRAFLMNNPKYIDSETYFNENEKQLRSDVSFGLASVRAAKISFDYWIGNVDTEALMANATPVELNLFEKLMKEV